MPSRHSGLLIGERPSLLDVVAPGDVARRRGAVEPSGEPSGPVATEGAGGGAQMRATVGTEQRVHGAILRPALRDLREAAALRGRAAIAGPALASLDDPAPRRVPEIGAAHNEVVAGSARWPRPGCGRRAKDPGLHDEAGLSIGLDRVGLGGPEPPSRGSSCPAGPSLPPFLRGGGDEGAARPVAIQATGRTSPSTTRTPRRPRPRPAPRHEAAPSKRLTAR